MAEFFDIALAFPTLLFTVPLALAAVYWAFVLVGAVDLEILDGIDGLLDGATASVDGALDGAVEGALDGAMDGALDGAAEGADGMEVRGGLLLAFVSAIGLGRVPATVALTMLLLWCWAACFLVVWAAAQVGFAGVVVALAAPVIAFFVGAFVTSWAVTPLEPVFRTELARTNRDFVGEVCTIETGKVTATFGQASLSTTSDHLLVQVRSDDPNNDLRRGVGALVVGWDADREAFLVAPLPIVDSES